MAAFYTKRFLRIAPLFYVVILLWSARRAYYGVPFPSIYDLLINVIFVFNLVPEKAGSLVFAGWTIGVEMLFYLCFPLFWRILLTTRRKAAALIVSIPVAQLVDMAIASSTLQPEVKISYSLLVFFRHLPLFFMGMLAFDLHEYFRSRSDGPSIAMIAMVGSIAIFAALIGQTSVIVPPLYWQGLASALALMAYSLRPMPMVNGLTAFLGRISYSIYLLHGLAIVSMGEVFHFPYRAGLPDTISFALACMLAFAVIIPLSWLTYVLIEEPGNAFARHLLRRSRVRRTAKTTERQRP